MKELRDKIRQILFNHDINKPDLDETLDKLEALIADEKKALLDTLEQEFVAASPAFFKEDDKRKGYLLALKVFGGVINKLKELEDRK